MNDEDRKKSDADAPDDAPAARRGVDEVEFLDSRAKAIPLRAPLAREKLRAFTKTAVRNEGQAGRVAHDEGEALNELYVRHVDAALGYASFADLVEKEYPRHPSLAYRHMRIAKAFTGEEATSFGATKCDIALQLIDALGLIPANTEERTKAQRDAFGKLRRTKLQLPERMGGGTTKFPSTVRELRGALWLLHNPGADEASENDGELAETRAFVAKVVAEDSAIAAIKPRAWADKDGVAVRVDARGRAGAAAAARLYERLARRR